MSDKRKVSTDALETLGTVIGPNEKRDAIHLAVIPMQAGCTLHAGSNVGVHRDGKAYDGVDKFVGIVDPFLRGGVNEGEWFWLVIYPRQIDSLRHVWTHPDIPDDVPAAPVFAYSESELGEAKSLLERLAEANYCSYDDILVRLNEIADVGYGTLDDGFSEDFDPTAVWRAFEKLTSRSVPAVVISSTTIQCCA